MPAKRGEAHVGNFNDRNVNRDEGILRRDNLSRVPALPGTSGTGRAVFRWPRIFAALAIVVASGGCGILGSSEDRNDGRIVIGVSVDNVALGIDTLSIRRILGPPTSISRGPGSVVYRFARGDHAGLEVRFSLDADRRLERRTVFGMTAPFSGRTNGGNGIGSRRTDVIQELGEPDFSGAGTSGLVHDRYRTEEAETSFLYDEGDRVLSITMNGPLP